MQHATVQQALDQLHLGADGIVAPDFLFHRCGRSPTVQADDRVPTALVGGGQVFDEARRLDALVVRNVGAGLQHLREFGGGGRVVVFVGAGQGDDQAARDLVGQAVHVVDLRGQQQLADVAVHRVGHEGVAVFVLRCVDAGRHTTGVEAFGDFDEFHHRLAQVALLVGVEAVGFAHQRARPNQQIAETRARRNAAVAVVGGVAVGQHLAVFPLAGVEHPLPGHEHPVEHHHRCGLPVAAREQRVAMLQLVPGAPSRARHDGDARVVDPHRAAHGKRLVFAAHVAAWHDHQFVHIGAAGHDGLGAADHNALAVALHHMHIGVGVGLLVRLLAAVAFGVGHGHADGQVVVLRMGQVGVEPCAVFGGAPGVVDARHRLRQAVERIVRQVALGTAGFLAQQPHRFELVEQVASRLVEMQHAVDDALARGLGGQRHRRQLRPQGKVVGVGQCVHAGSQRGLVHHTADFATIHKHPGLVAPQRFAVVVTRHQGGTAGGCFKRGVHGVSGARGSGGESKPSRY